VRGLQSKTLKNKTRRKEKDCKLKKRFEKEGDEEMRVHTKRKRPPERGGSGEDRERGNPAVGKKGEGLQGRWGKGPKKRKKKQSLYPEKKKERLQEGWKRHNQGGSARRDSRRPRTYGESVGGDRNGKKFRGYYVT